MQYQELGCCIRRDPLDRRLIVGQVLYQCKRYMANIILARCPGHHGEQRDGAARLA